jgi:ABC-type transporter Mla subunit MlaD
MAAIQFIKNYSHLLIIVIICVCLWKLNARSSQLEATNQRLVKLANSKEEQIYDLRSKNDGLASSVTELVTAVKQQNDVMSQVAEQRAETAQQNRKLQNEIKHYLAADKCAVAPVPPNAAARLRHAAKAAGGVPDSKAAAFSPSI